MESLCNCLREEKEETEMYLLAEKETVKILQKQIESCELEKMTDKVDKIKKYYQ